MTARATRRHTGRDVAGRCLAVRGWLTRVAALLALTVAACSGGGSPTAPSGASLTIATSTTSLSPNGSAVITAQLLTSSGQPRANVAVSFSATIGRVEPPELVTDASGSATVVFSAGTASGMAVISARSGNLSATPLNLAVGTASIGRVLLAADPASLPAAGGSSTITATVTDAKGNPLPTMPVAFTTTAGNVVPANAKTDANGQVLTTLSSKAAATVTAVAGITPNDGSTGVTQVSGSLLVALGAKPQPTVTITPSADPVAGTPMTFTIGVVPAAGSTTTIQDVTIWFGDGESRSLGAATGAAIIAQHVYTVGGTYTVTVTATDSGGGTTTASAVIAVAFSAPLAVTVTAGPMAPAGGGPNTIVTLTATVAPPGAVISGYQWDFGDGQQQTTTANTLQHRYATAGLYTVTVIATDAATGINATGSVPVSTASARPTVTIAAGASPVTGSATTFTLGVIPAPGSNTTITSVTVDYGDGTAPADLGGASGTGIVAQHVYGIAGTYTATVTAIDSGGGLATASVVVVVAASAGPTVSVSATPNSVAGTAVTFTIAAAAGPTGGALASIQIQYGDGASDLLGPAGGSPFTTQHVYASAGSYPVRVTVTDVNGNANRADTIVVVAAPGAPTVSVSASANPVVNTNTTFTVTVSTPAGVTIQSALLSFGDGATANLGAIPGTATAQHAYLSAGNYTASVTVTTSTGVSATGSTAVVVASAPPPTVSITPPSAVTTQSVTQFTIATTPATATSTVTNVAVSFGDGSPVANLGSVGASTTTQHVYTNPGTFTVTATATDSGGGTATATRTVVVVAPIAVSVTAGPTRYTLIPTTFTISVSPASGIAVQNVNVSWNDGTSENLGVFGNPPATRQHVYGSPGTYTVTVTATAGGGISVSGSTTVTIAALPPVTTDVQLINIAPSAFFSDVTLRAIVSPPAGLVTVVSATLDFGNGSSTTVPVGTTDHTRIYPWLQVFTATLTVTDSVGRVFVDQVTFAP